VHGASIVASTRSGGQSVFTCRSKLGLPADEVTMAELLGKAGYRTHMCVHAAQPRAPQHQQQQQQQLLALLVLCETRRCQLTVCTLHRGLSNLVGSENGI
jgi:hypothetical protein